MLRPAVPADLPNLLAIRDASGADALSDPALIAADYLAELIAAGAVSVWDDDGRAVGFAAVSEDDGAIRALLVDPRHRGKGVGRALLDAACAVLKNAGCLAATLGIAAGGSAGRHYRAAGWVETAPGPTGGFVLKKPL
ncbi:MAG TPA: GNAT family N-acetyltransferase [Stellaceae bacterium]|nr:GNAT family N-acetyltransferase [Stellaceae bacterium]